MSSSDPWLLPSNQAEHPARPILIDATLHGRREGTFLILAATFLVVTAITPLLGLSPAFDLIARLHLGGHGLPAAVLPFGVLAFPLGFLAVNLVGELWGFRRATALVVVGLVASLGVAGLVRLSDAAADRPPQFGAALAFAACTAIAHLSNVMLFEGLSRRRRGRRLWLRANLATLIAQLGGWAAFAFVMYGYAVGVRGEPEATTIDATGALLVGAGAYAIAFALVAALPLSLAASGLGVYLRIDDDRPRDDDSGVIEQPAFVRQLPPPPPQPQPRTLKDKDKPENRDEIRPFTSAEMRFFTEGDAIAD